MKKIIFGAIFSVFVLAVVVTPASAVTPCTFTTVGSVNTLDANCTTDVTITIPDGFTLDGAGYSITAVDPSSGHFKGAVIANEGATVYVKNLTVKAEGLVNACDAGTDRLRGIMFEGASGSITNSSVMDINQGASGCQEGNAIEVRNTPFDDTHPNTVYVELAHNTITDYQKTGIVANGDVNVNIHHNKVGESATQLNLAANSIQLGYGATGIVEHNSINGNQWMGTSDYAASAILVYLANGVTISKNNIGGNSDIGLYIYGDNAVVDNNRVFDEGADHANSSYDYGIGNWGTGNVVTNNKVKGFDTSYEGVEGGKNKSIPGPQKVNLWF